MNSKTTIEDITLIGDDDTTVTREIEEIEITGIEPAEYRGADYGDDSGYDGSTIPYEAIKYVSKCRTDIDTIGWDDAYADTYPGGENNWNIPVEAVFTVERDGVMPSEAGMNHGTLVVELDGDGDVIDFSVGDWTPGAHPDLHTNER